MLACGCGNVDCTFKLCRSCSTSKKVSLEMASALAVSLASKNGLMLCPKIKSMGREDIESNVKNQVPKVKPDLLERNISSSFLSKMISFSSLNHIFDPKAQSSKLILNKKNSSNDLALESSRMQQLSFSQKGFKNLIENKIPLDKTNIQRSKILSKESFPVKPISLIDPSFDINSKGLDYLNQQAWKQIVSEYKNSGDLQGVVDKLITIYSSRTRIGRSFLLDTNSKTSELNLNDIDCFYTEISQLVKI